MLNKQAFGNQDITRAPSGGSTDRGEPMDSGHYSNPSKTQNPGLISKEDADTAANIAKLVNLISIKFPKDTGLDAVQDINQGVLAKAPGDPRSGKENTPKREEPFKVDEVKASSARSLYKLALFDPNIDPEIPGNRGPQYTVPQRVMPSMEQTLSKLLQGPFLGDFAANSATGPSQPIGDTRSYGPAPYNDLKGISGDPNKPLTEQHPQQYGTIGSLRSNKRLNNDDISSRYMPGDPGLLKASAAIPQGNVMSDEEYNNPNEDTNLESQRPIANLKINKTTVLQPRAGAGRAVIKKGTFLTHFFGRSNV